MIAEVAGGWWANSLALLADAGHMLSDTAALGLSLFAIWFARRPATRGHSYGYYRAEILAALLNGATLIAIAIFIFFEAYQRLREPPAVKGLIVTVIAAGGLLINLAGLWILSGGRKDNLNVRGAWLHVLTDALGSVGAILAGGAVWLLGWQWADPAVSVVIALLVVYSSWALVKESVSVLMEGTPRGIEVDAVRDAILAVPGVEAVHDLHVWSITTGMNSLSAHVVTVAEATQFDVLRSVRKTLHDQFGIYHVTIQIEPDDIDESHIHA